MISLLFLILKGHQKMLKISEQLEKSYYKL